MKRQNVRTLGLLAATIFYLLIGAVVFDQLESENEKSEAERLEKLEDELKKNLSITDEDFEILRKTIIQSKPYRAGIQWKFAGGLYFALSVITTIGYGHSTPKTIGGKLFCMFYATVGIPLNIVMFQSIGERFNVFLAYLIGAIKRCLHLRNIKVGELESITMGGLLCCVVLAGGAAAFSALEHWNFLESFYYCFITMSTIGFGDYVALQNETTEALQTQPGYVTFCIIYILCGLTVFAAALNKMVLGLLTMNTADERKDELQAQAEAQRAPTLDGDVIVGNESFRLDLEMNGQPRNYSSESMVVSTRHSKLLTQNAASQNGDCLQNLKSAYLKPAIKGKKFSNRLRLSKLRYSAKHKPCQSVSHLLPTQPGTRDGMSAQSGFTPLIHKRQHDSHLSFLSLDSDLQPPDSADDSEGSNVFHRNEQYMMEKL